MCVLEKLSFRDFVPVVSNEGSRLSFHTRQVPSSNSKAVKLKEVDVAWKQAVSFFSSIVVLNSVTFSPLCVSLSFANIPDLLPFPSNLARLHVNIALTSFLCVSEGLGGRPSSRKELADDGLYAVDGWLHGPSLQPWHSLLNAVATNIGFSRNLHK